MNSIVTSTSAVVMRLLTDADRALDADRGAAKTYIAQAAAILREEDDRFVPASEVTRISSRGRLAQWQLHKVCAYVEQNLDQEIRASTLASLSRLSASYFPVTFKRTFGETLHVYLTRRRVQRAQDMMLTTDLLLGQIALDCGFCDQAHFCRVFRQSVGLTPNQWRHRTKTRVM